MKKKITPSQKYADETERRHQGKDKQRYPDRIYCEVVLLLLFNPLVSKHSYVTNCTMAIYPIL